MRRPRTTLAIATAGMKAAAGTCLAFTPSTATAAPLGAATTFVVVQGGTGVKGQ